MADYINTRDLIEERDDLKEQILDEFNDRFFTELDCFEDIETYLEDEAAECHTEEERDDFFDYMSDEYNAIREIDELEQEMDSYEWSFGVTLINDMHFEDYCRDSVADWGYVDKNTPQLIINNIDWNGIAEDMIVDYIEIEFRGYDYLYVT